MRVLLVAILALTASAENREAHELEQNLSAEAKSMKERLQATLEQYLAKSKQDQEQESKTREARWANIIAKQQSALLEEERKIQTESKELERLQREKQWLKETEARAEIEEKKQQVEELKTQLDKECGTMSSSVNAFIVATQDQDQLHANCLKGQLGTCATSQQHDAVFVRECKESSAGWQKKCLADRAQEMSQCAPAGADWAALRRGQKGEEADNAALQHLSDWCTFNNLLVKVDEAKTTTPYAFVLNKRAAVNKDAMSKVGEYAQTFGSEDWDLVKVDGSTESMMVRAENAEKIRQAMLTMKAKPLDALPQALLEAGIKVKDWTAGVAGVQEYQDGESCSLKAPAF